MVHRGSLMSAQRRQFIKGSAAFAAGAGITPGVWAAGSDAPEKKEVRIGFIPLTDCASVVMASVLKFDEKYGIKIIPTKEASWAGVRDKLVNGELDMAHVLYGLVYGVHLGVGGPKKDMAVLMTLNHNGQAITLSKKLADKGAVDGASLAKLMAGDKREYTFAQTFPTGTHAMWLYYWLAACGHQPDEGRQGHHRAAAADGGQHARGQHGRLLRRRAVEPPRHHRRHRHHRGDFTGRLEGPPGKGARHHRRVRQEEPEHRARRDDGGARGQPLDRCQPDQQEQDGRDHRREGLRQHQRRCHQPAHPGPLPERPGQDLGRPEPHEVLQRRCGQLPVPERRHVVPDPAQALGPAEGAIPTTWPWPGRSTRPSSTSRPRRS